MKLIIDIPEDKYKEIVSGIFNADSYFKTNLTPAFRNCTPIPDNIGDFSDGYHTFNQLYHQRAVLFATIVNLNKNISWKSWKHDDGKYCFDSNGEWFIVGIDTPQGSYTYHYEKAYWDMFKCQELSNGKHWDGHTEDDVIRLLSLVPSVHIPDNATNERMVGSWIKSRDSYGTNHFTCPFCEHDIATRNADNWDDNYCSNCGARMVRKENNNADISN